MMVEDRGSIGLNELGKAAQEIIRDAHRSSPHLRGSQPPSAPPARKSSWISTAPWWSRWGSRSTMSSQTLETYLGSTYVNQFNKFNQSFQVRVQAGADYRRELQDISNLYVANRGPDGTAGRAARCPAHAGVGVADAL